MVLISGLLVVRRWLTKNVTAMLTLKRAAESRPSGTWSDDDYDVFDGEQHIGRILLDARGQQRLRHGSEKSRRACRNARMIEAMRVEAKSTMRAAKYSSARYRP